MMNGNWKIRYWASTAGPWATFLVSLGVAGLLYHGGSERSHIKGFVQGEEIAIAPLQLGRIVSVGVESGQPVRAGQVVAMLDASTIDNEIMILEAERTEIEARITAEKTAVERDHRNDARRLDNDVEQLRLALTKEEEAFFRAKAEMTALEEERRRLRQLVSDHFATTDDLARLDVRYAAIEKEVQDKPRTIRLLREQLRSAERRRDVGAGDSDIVGVAVQPLVLQLEVIEKRLERLHQDRLSLALRAPADGNVTIVHKRSGEVIAEGEPVVSVECTPGAQIVACLPEAEALSVDTGDRARLWSLQSRGSKELSGKVIALSPRVEELPVRCRRTPTQPEWGRNAVILLDDPVDLIPGQPFDVLFERRREGTGSGTAIAQSPLPGEDDPQSMEVPEELVKLSRLEPSGILWQKNLLRYLLVSDDTGYPNDNDHAPWIFTMTVDGKVEPYPLPLTGIDEVNDLESIAPGEGGAIYMLSSQSHSKRGRRLPSRTAFLKVVPNGSGYRVAGEAHLAELLDVAGPKYWERLGIPDGTRDLNIEGMTYHQGALLLGLKSPLSADGLALIWRLENPDSLFEPGGLDRAGLSLWAQVDLDARQDNTLVPRGVSELLSLPDGSLLITSTVSKRTGEIESGYLWSVSEAQPGLLSARLVRTFPGLKPEGISLSPIPGRIVIAFDADDNRPYWIELSWPV